MTMIMLNDMSGTEWVKWKDQCYTIFSFLKHSDALILAPLILRLQRWNKCTYVYFKYRMEHLSFISVYQHIVSFYNSFRWCCYYYYYCSLFPILFNISWDVSRLLLLFTSTSMLLLLSHIFFTSLFWISLIWFMSCMSNKEEIREL